MKHIPNPEKAFSVACGCGAPAGMDCPHTPIRCPHQWWYGKNPSSLHETVPEDQKVGGRRECAYCGRVEEAALSWKSIIA